MTEPRFARVIVGLDDSDGARHALVWSGRLARATGAELHVVHVMSASGDLMLAVAQVDTDMLRTERERLLRGPWTAPLREQGLTFRCDLLEGNPAKVLMELADAEDADLIVVGATGHGTLGELLLGSVSHNLVHHARRPVVVVP